MNDYVQLTAFDLETLREKIAILNKKAKKLGCEPAQVEVLDEVVVERKKTMPGGRVLKYNVTVFNVTVTGSTPKLAGWSLVAKVEYLGDEKLISCVPGETCPVHFRTGGLHCNHCGSIRRRKSVFVLKHDDGDTFKSVANASRTSWAARAPNNYWPKRPGDSQSVEPWVKPATAGVVVTMKRRSTWSST